MMAKVQEVAAVAGRAYELALASRVPFFSAVIAEGDGENEVSVNWCGSPQQGALAALAIQEELQQGYGVDEHLGMAIALLRCRLGIASHKRTDVRGEARQ